ncbi:MAG: hypothetical protein QXE64_01415 [Candidatus Pacearchaeota archaeon]
MSIALLAFFEIRHGAIFNVVASLFHLFCACLKDLVVKEINQKTLKWWSGIYIVLVVKVPKEKIEEKKEEKKEEKEEKKVEKDIKSLIFKNQQKFLLYFYKIKNGVYQILSRESNQTYIYTTKIIKLFEKNNLVAIEKEKKKKIVKLTPKGEKIAKSISEIQELV